MPTWIAAHRSGAPALANLPCDRADGRIECGFYIQIAGIQQDRRLRPAAWVPTPGRASRSSRRRMSARTCLVGRPLRPGPSSPGGAARRATSGAAVTKDLNVGLGAHHGRRCRGRPARRPAGVRRRRAGTPSRAARTCGSWRRWRPASASPGPRRAGSSRAGGVELARRRRRRSCASSRLRPAPAHIACHGTVEQARVEVGQAEMGGNAASPACPCRTRPAHRWR